MPVAAAVCIFIFLVDTAGNEPCIVVVTEVIFLLVFAGKLLRKPEHSVTQLSPPRLFKVCLKTPTNSPRLLQLVCCFGR